MDNNIGLAVNQFLESSIEYLVNMIIEISSIPSPTGSESAKADFILKKLHEIKAEEAYIDDAGNVLFLYDPIKTEKISAYCAHIDTVFGDIEKIEPYISENKIYAPSSADNSANIAGLLLMVKMLIELNMVLPQGILFAFDVGEEGLGNLNGIRHIVDKWRDRISEVIAVDGSSNCIVNKAVGSKRYSVAVETEGGHSFSDFGKDNAILIAAKIIKEIYEQDVPDSPKTTYNIGVIKGGTSVNSIAGNSEFMIDLRSESQICLYDLDKTIRSLVNKYNTDNIRIRIDPLGDRPSGMINGQTGIEKRISGIRSEAGLSTEFHSSSTDANIPLSVGIPAISFGIWDGGKIHTIHEYLKIDSLETGIKQLAHFILYDA